MLVKYTVRESRQMIRIRLMTSGLLVVTVVFTYQIIRQITNNNNRGYRLADMSKEHKVMRNLPYKFK